MTLFPRTTTRHPRLRRSLRRDTSGVAMLEFGLALPVVLAIGCYGLEVANLAILNMRVSQIALALADNASRVGTFSTLSTQQLREIDMNDVLKASRTQGTSIQLGTRGRITLSSLENIQQKYDKAPVQRVHWQRCFGVKSGTGYDSSYNPGGGTVSTSAGSDDTEANAGLAAPDGMGPATSRVKAPEGSGVMFVEVNYLTKPLFGSWLMGPRRIQQVASFLVRDRRDFSRLYDPKPEVGQANWRTCNVYAS